MPARQAMPAAARFDAAGRLLDAAARTRAFPSAVAEVGCGTAAQWCHVCGALSYEPDAPPATADTVFDLASLTKVISTGTIIARLAARGALELDAPVGVWLPGWRGLDRAAVTIRQLLDHSSGLPSHVDLFKQCRDAAAFEAVIADVALAYEPGSQAVYSDLGFILLGFIIERAGGRSLRDQFADVADQLDPFVDFLPPARMRDIIAPTERDAWRGRVLQGEVHDENAYALGGVAGHAGLFGTAGAVGSFARAMLASLRAPNWIGTPEFMRVCVSPSAVPGSSRALAWDTMRPTSSCGTLMSPTAVGHTGFTGTSLWIDWERDVYVVLLTNRVHPTRENAALVALRPQFHDAVMRALEED
jgi:CubicO group peptidase (beta-lactamase class C family)